MDINIKFDDAITNYLTLSSALGEDLKLVLDSDNGSVAWKRNFIRVALAVIEGNCHCFREFCEVAMEAGQQLSKKRQKAITDERSCSASDRIKYNIQSAYEAFEIDQAPNFGGQEWKQAEKAIIKRDKIIHPKTIQDLEISESEWQQYHNGIVWLIQNLISFIEAAQEKYNNQSS